MMALGGARTKIEIAARASSEQQCAQSIEGTASYGISHIRPDGSSRFHWTNHQHRIQPHRHPRPTTELASHISYKKASHATPHLSSTNHRFQRAGFAIAYSLPRSTMRTIICHIRPPPTSRPWGCRTLPSPIFNADQHTAQTHASEQVCKSYLLAFNLCFACHSAACQHTDSLIAHHEKAHKAQLRSIFTNLF